MAAVEPSLCENGKVSDTKDDIFGYFYSCADQEYKLQMELAETLRSLEWSLEQRKISRLEGQKCPTRFPRVSPTSPPSLESLAFKDLPTPQNDIANISKGVRESIWSLKHDRWKSIERITSMALNVLLEAYLEDRTDALHALDVRQSAQWNQCRVNQQLYQHENEQILQIHNDSERSRLCSLIKDRIILGARRHLVLYTKNQHASHPRNNSLQYKMIGHTNTMRCTRNIRRNSKLSSCTRKHEMTRFFVKGVSQQVFTPFVFAIENDAMFLAVLTRRPIAVALFCSRVQALLRSIVSLSWHGA
jgi:hypothetical protein